MSSWVPSKPRPHFHETEEGVLVFSVEFCLFIDQLYWFARRQFLWIITKHGDRLKDCSCFGSLLLASGVFMSQPTCQQHMFCIFYSHISGGDWDWEHGGWGQEHAVTVCASEVMSYGA